MDSASDDEWREYLRDIHYIRMVRIRSERNSNGEQAELSCYSSSLACTIDSVYHPILTSIHLGVSSE